MRRRRRRRRRRSLPHSKALRPLYFEGLSSCAGGGGGGGGVVPGLLFRVFL